MNERERQQDTGRPDRCDEHPGDVAQQTAVLYALDALLADEATEFQKHLERGCEFCLGETSAFKELLAEVGEAVGAASASPPPGLRSRLMERIAADAAIEAAEPDVQVWKSWEEQPESTPGLSIVLASEGSWEPLAVPGVSVKRLSVDRERRTATMLVRMEPGMSYPRHRHAGLEQCFVLEGDLRVGDTTLRAGDYQEAAADSTHGVQSTEEGCLLLITSSQDDELL